MATTGTIEGELRKAAALLGGAGIERARVDAELLLAHVLGARRIDLLIHGDRPLSPEQAEEFAELVRRRAARTPLPYLTGEREFMGLRFRVNEHVLIPRPETEVLVEDALRSVGVCGYGGMGEGQGPEERGPGDVAATAPPARLPSFLSGPPSTPPCPHTPTLVDVGTGSGAIAISLAHRVPEARVLATEISPEAGAVARENAARLGVAERVTILEGDLLAPVVELLQGVPPEARAAVVCANLPYVPSESLAALQPEVRDWEPRLALDGGPGGLRLVERLLEQVPRVLRPGGALLLEIGPEAGQPERLAALLAASGRFAEIRVLPDLAGLPRVVCAVFAGGDCR